LGTPRSLPGRLHRRQQEGDQDGDDRDDNQELDQGEPCRAPTRHGFTTSTSHGLSSIKPGDEKTKRIYQRTLRTIPKSREDGKRKDETSGNLALRALRDQAPPSWRSEG